MLTRINFIKEDVLFISFQEDRKIFREKEN